MPSGFKVAAAWVSVSPDTTGFAEKLDADLAAQEREIRIPAVLDSSRVAASAEKARAQVEAEGPAKIPALLDTGKVAVEAEKARAEVEAEPAAKIKVEPDDASLAALKAKVDAAAQDTGGGAGGLMAAAIGAGVLMGGPVVGAAVAGIGATGLIALGAKLQAGDPTIASGWESLVNDAKVSATAYSAAMVEPISGALDQIDADLQRQEPLIQRMFSSAAGDIPIFTNGLLSLVDNSLPGFDNAMAHSQVIMQGLASLMGSTGAGISDIGNQVASSSNRIGTDMADLGNIVHSVETAVGSLVSISSGLAEGALPALDGAVSLVTGTLSGLHSLLGPIEPELGGIATVAGGAYLAFSKLQPVADKLTLSLASKGGLLGQLSGLTGSIPVVGAVVTGLSLVTGILAEQSEKAAQAATDEARSSDNLNKALSSVTNATQAQIDGMVFQNAAGQNWLRTAQDTSTQTATLTQILAAAGVTQNQFSAAIENGGGQMDGVRSKLDHLVDSMNNANASGQNLTDFQINQAEGASELAGHLNDLATAYQGSAAATEEQAIQTAQANLGLDHATLNSEQLTGDLQVLGAATSTTTARTTALTDALALMANGGVEPANDALAQAWSTVNGLGSALQGTSGRLLDTTGQLDLTTTKGEAANTAIEQLRNQTAAYAQALSSQGLSSADVQTKTQALVSQMVGPLAKALGLSQSQVQTLIAQYDLVPATIVTTIDANTAPAFNAVQTLLTRISNTNATIDVNVAAGAAQHGVQIPQALGGIVKFWADGGIGARALSPMPPIAQMVPPNAMRVVGDRSDVDEAYIPLDGSRRSRNILAEANRAMGDGGGTVNNYNTNHHWNVSTQDPYQAAKLVAAQQAWNNLIGVHG